MKKTLSTILTFLAVISLLSACGNEPTQTNNTSGSAENSSVAAAANDTASTAQPTDPAEVETSPLHTIYFNDCTKSSDATATFFNSITKETKDVPMKKESEDDTSVKYSCEEDTSVYNMAYVTYGDKQSGEFAFNKCVSGWQQTEDNFYPYTEGIGIEEDPQFDDITITGYGCEKKVHVWKPADYDANSSEKYSTVYVLDGQMIAAFGKTSFNPDSHPSVVEQVEAMNLLTGSKTLIVAIESDAQRDVELVPDMELSKSERDAQIPGLDEEKHEENDDEDEDCMTGIQFAHFMANKLVPYIQENYNVYTDARHTAISGNSLGGMEAFYIGVEYPESFGTVGSFSPSLYQFNGDLWKTYLSEKTFGDNSPFIYFYTGPAGVDTDPDVTEMYNRLKEMGYPAENLALHYNENGDHSGISWRSVFSEYLNAIVFRSIKPLQQ